MSCKYLLIAVGLCQVINGVDLQITVSKNPISTCDPDPSLVGCECVRPQEVFDILQAIITGSGLRHLGIITDTPQEECGDLVDLQGTFSSFSCSSWDFELFLTAPVHHKKPLISMLINCSAHITESIVHELIAARSSGGVERRLLLPVYNLIVVQPVGDNVTLGLDLSGIHQVSIVRNPIPTLYKAGCWRSDYEIQIQEGHGARRVVGRYNGSYQGDPGFVRNTFVNFEGMHLKVTQAMYPPFTKMKGGVYYGFCIDLLENLARQLNFTYKLINSIDGQFGAKQLDGRWNGMIGMMERKEVDMAMAGLTISGIRETVVDFSIPFFEEPSAVVVRADIVHSEILWSYLFNPLQSYVWIAAASSLVVCAVIINGFEQLARYITYQNNGGSMDHLKHAVPSLGGSVWLMVCIYAKQAGERLPLAGSVRLILGVFWLLALLVLGLFNTNLTASLAAVEQRLPFNTLEELAKDTVYTILVERNVVHMSLLENSKSRIYAALWAKMMKTKEASFVSSNAAGLKRMFNDSQGQKYALIGDKTSLTSHLKRNYSSRCDWALIPETFFTSGFGIALPEGSPYKEVFDNGLIIAMSSGLTMTYQKRHFYKSSCDEIKQGTHTESKNINLSHIRSIFILLLVGIAVSTAVFLLEHLFKKCCSRSGPMVD